MTEVVEYEVHELDHVVLHASGRRAVMRSAPRLVRVELDVRDRRKFNRIARLRGWRFKRVVPAVPPGP